MEGKQKVLNLYNILISMMYGNMNIHLQRATHGVMLSMMNQKAVSIMSNQQNVLLCRLLQIIYPKAKRLYGGSKRLPGKTENCFKKNISTYKQTKNPCNFGIWIYQEKNYGTIPKTIWNFDLRII